MRVVHRSSVFFWQEFWVRHASSLTPAVTVTPSSWPLNRIQFSGKGTSPFLWLHLGIPGTTHAFFLQLTPSSSSTGIDKSQLIIKREKDCWTVWNEAVSPSGVSPERSCVTSVPLPGTSQEAAARKEEWICFYSRKPGHIISICLPFKRKQQNLPTNITEAPRLFSEDAALLLCKN